MAEKKTSKQKEILQKAGNAGKDALLIVGGMVLGSLANKGIDKIMKVDGTTNDGKLSLKSFAAPLITISGGGALAVLTKNNNMRLVGIGVAGSGVIKTVKVFLKKDILNGFDGLGDSDEPIDLKVDAYNPELPPISGTDFLPVETEELSSDEELNYTEFTEVPVS